jgi:hypothetical protein
LDGGTHQVIVIDDEDYPGAASAFIHLPRLRWVG